MVKNEHNLTASFHKHKVLKCLLKLQVPEACWDILCQMYVSLTSSSLP